MRCFKKKLFLAIYCFVFIVCIGKCDKYEAENVNQAKNIKCERDPFYKNDIPYNGSKQNSFHYPPKEFPVIGNTTEKELYEMYKYTINPDTIRSLKKTVIITIKGRKIKIDKYLRYIDYRKKEKRYLTKDGDYAFERKHNEYIDFHILLYKKIVVYYTTHHFIKTKKGDWIPGKYHNGYTIKLRDEHFPGKSYIGCMYLFQRSDTLCQIGKKYTQAECDKKLKESRPWR